MDGWHRRAIALLALLMLVVSSCSPPDPVAAQSFDVPNTATPTETPTATRTPVVPTATPTATPTPTPGIHHLLTARRCMDFVAAVRFVSNDYPELDPTLVLAVAAKESGCDPNGTDAYSDSTGLMQVNPQGLAHLGITKGALLDPVRNITWGMRILTLTLNDEVHNPEHDVRTALAAYNCGWTSLEAGRCYSFGGFTYADSILEEWVPAVEMELSRYVCDPPEALGKWRVREDVLGWLETWGYRPPC